MKSKRRYIMDCWYGGGGRHFAYRTTC